MVIGRGRRREHPKDTSKGVTTGVAQLPVAHAHIQGNPEWIKWPSVTPGNHVTTVLLLRKKTREKPGMSRTYFRSGSPLDRASSGHVTDVTSVQKTLLLRIWRNFRLRMRITYFRTWHLTDVISGHVTDITFGHITSGHVISPHSTPSNANWSVPIYYSHHSSFQWYMI